MPEVLLIKSDFPRKTEWRDAFADFDIEIREWQTPGAPEDITYALVWQPEPGALARYPNLKIIFSIGAGLDHLIGENILPPAIPVVRMVEEVLTAGMTEYILYNTLRFHRHMPLYDADQRTQTWKERLQTPAWHRKIGILGLGVLGSDAARTLTALRFQVSGWSRTPKDLPQVKSYYGDDQLPAFLAQSEILICLLPLTPQTQGILNAQNLARLPRGAFIINAGRGGHCVEADLLQALNSGQIKGAALDVFHQEPLPKTNPLWKHPAIHITPHIASMTLPATSAQHVIANIRHHRNGEPLTHLADFKRGY